ncbi:MAG: DUF1273 family protein [Oscillospiraceae bacterium]|jgi:uncharacterized phage-like protein YoqJ|nr:DUF1273 family protein [Oscillospiraceae bacterium]MBR6862894.1 DUF1273 family protein [Acidaminococcaceae bacterium]
MPSEQEMRLHRCCFTGHRPEKLAQSPEEVQQWLTDQIKDAIADGYLTFITGMSMGVDIWAGEIIVNLRENDPRLHLIAAVPWPRFSARWNAEWKTRYERLIKRADLVKHISRTYDPSVFTKRNFWMVEHCTRVIAFYNGSDGGTKEMIEYAQERDIDVVIGGIIPPKKKPAKELDPGPVPQRDYPLNLIDAIMDCETYQNSKIVCTDDIPADFDDRLRKAASTIKDERAYELLRDRYREGCTLQAIAEREDLSRERIRQLLEKYIKRLRNPDILRYLDCGIENIPGKTSAAMVERLR